MGVIKFICGAALIFLGCWIGKFGFGMPNASAADLCFGGGLLSIFLGLICWSI